MSNNNPLNNNLNLFESWLSRKNLAVETIKIKLRHIKHFGERAITTDNIVSFLKENHKYTPHHLENLRNSLGSYTKFLKIYNEVEWEIVNKIIPKIQPKLRTIIDKSELAILKSANNLRHKVNNNDRDNLILDFFLNTGLRISELVGIKHNHYQNNQLKD
ncbi:MAG: Tyrosine recombinase XerC [Mycoplasmataceae bacterium]|nr:MAG: Tyrosine recombinase XerC [Mycoplasmataceae bacterium]